MKPLSLLYDHHVRFLAHHTISPPEPTPEHLSLLHLSHSSPRVKAWLKVTSGKRCYYPQSLTAYKTHVGVQLQ